MVRPEGADIQAVGTKVVYENRWMRVREDAVRRRDGSEGIYGVVEKADFVVIVPVEDDGRMHLVQQFRYPVGGRYWELPQGSWEATPNADPLALARGELEEETGLVAEEMTYGGHLFQGYGYATQGYHVFLAKGLRHNGARLEVEEQDLVTCAFNVSEVERMVLEHEIKDATTVAALGLLRLKKLL